MTDSARASEREITKFGVMFGILALAVAAFIIYRHGSSWPWFIGAACFFGLTGLFAHPVLRPIHKWWMKFAALLAWVNTRLILGLFFYLVLTPVGVILRLMGKDLLDEKIDRSASSYWIKRDQAITDRSRYERLF